MKIFLVTQEEILMLTMMIRKKILLIILTTQIFILITWNKDLYLSNLLIDWISNKLIHKLIEIKNFRQHKKNILTKPLVKNGQNNNRKEIPN